MKIIIPISKNMQEFDDKGYSIPFYQIDLKGKSLLKWTINSLVNLMDNELVFLINKEDNATSFIEETMQEFNLYNPTIIEKDSHINGICETMSLLEGYLSDDEEILILNPTFIVSPESLENKINDVKKNIKVIQNDAKNFNIKKSKIDSIDVIYLKEYKKLYSAKKSDIEIENWDNDDVRYLRSLEDLKYFDYDFEKNCTDKEPYKRILENGLEFDKLDSFYNEIIKTDERYIVNYWIFLLETGKIKEALELSSKFNIGGMLKSATVDETITWKANQILPIIDPINKTINYQKDEEKLLLELILSDRLHEKTDEELKNLINSSDKLWRSGILSMAVLNYQFDAYKLKVDLAHYYSTICSNFQVYSSFSRRYVFDKILSSLKRYESNSLFYGSWYNHIQKMLYLLTSTNDGKAQKAINRYLVDFYDAHKITAPQDIKLPPLVYKNKKENDKPKIALALVGMTPVDIYDRLLNYKEQIIDVEKYEFDVYVSTWSDVEIYNGIEDINKFPMTHLISRDNIAVPEEINNKEKFSALFPKTFDKLNEKEVISNEEKFFTDVFPKANIKFSSLKEFNKNINMEKTPGIARDLVSAKDLYLKYQMYKELENKDYDYVINIMMDEVAHIKNPIDNINILDFNEINAQTHVFLGIVDKFTIGTQEVMSRYYKVWEMVEQTKDISPLLHNGVKHNHIGNNIMNTWVVYAGIYPNNVDLVEIVHEKKEQITKIDKILDKELKGKSEEVVEYFENVKNKMFKGTISKDKE